MNYLQGPGYLSLCSSEPDPAFSICTLWPTSVQPSYILISNKSGPSLTQGLWQVKIKTPQPVGVPQSQVPGVVQFQE